jgi:hypothetical protein
MFPRGLLEKLRAFHASEVVRGGALSKLLTTPSHMIVSGAVNTLSQEKSVEPLFLKKFSYYRHVFVTMNLHTR